MMIDYVSVKVTLFVNKKGQHADTLPFLSSFSSTSSSPSYIPLPSSSSVLRLFFVCMQVRSVFGEGDRVCESKAKGRARAMGLLHLDDG